MNLQDLRYLVALAEHRHFGRAAEACNVSQPTLSSQIRKLEDDLGVTLLERTNKRVDLTPVGSQILIHAQGALAEARQMEAVARAARDPLVGALKLGVIPTLAPYLMPMILKPLRQAYPGLVIELWEDQTRALIELLKSLFSKNRSSPPCLSITGSQAQKQLPKRYWPVNSWCWRTVIACQIKQWLHAAQKAARRGAHCKAQCRRQRWKHWSTSLLRAMGPR